MSASTFAHRRIRRGLTAAMFGLIVPVAGACGGDDEAEPFAFASPDGDYKVTFPDGEPEEQSGEAPLGDGSTAPVVIFGVTHDDTSYLVARIQYPATPPDAAAELEYARDGAVVGSGGTLGESNPIDLGGVPGIEFTANVTSAGADGMVLVRSYLSGDVLYRVAVAAEGQPSFEDAPIAAFFDSFQLSIRSATETISPTTIAGEAVAPTTIAVTTLALTTTA